jgi:hypothetical protein
MPFYSVLDTVNSVSGLGKNGVNKSHIWVVWCPHDENHRAVLQITVRLGKRRSVREHLALQGLLSAVKRFQDEVRFQP